MLQLVKFLGQNITLAAEDAQEKEECSKKREECSMMSILNACLNVLKRNYGLFFKIYTFYRRGRCDFQNIFVMEEWAL